MGTRKEINTLFWDRIKCHLVCVLVSVFYIGGMIFIANIGAQDAIWLIGVASFLFITSLIVGWFLQRDGLLLEAWLVLFMVFAWWLKVPPFYSRDIGSAFLIYTVPVIAVSVLGVVLGGFLKRMCQGTLLKRLNVRSFRV